MNQISKTLPTAAIVLATLLALPNSVSLAQDFERTPLVPDTNWPESTISNEFPRVDQQVVPANFEAEISNRISTAMDSISIDSNAIESTSNDLLNQVKPFADDLTKSFREGTGAGWMADIKNAFGGADIGKLVSSLAIVLGGYFGFVWLMRQLNPQSSLGLPQEVVEVLGQTSFGAGKKLQLVRLGSKLLLLMNTSDGTQTIGEITEPSEV